MHHATSSPARIVGRVAFRVRPQGYGFFRSLSMATYFSMRRARVSGFLASYIWYRIAYLFLLSSAAKKSRAMSSFSSSRRKSSGTVAVLLRVARSERGDRQVRLGDHNSSLRRPEPLRCGRVMRTVEGSDESGPSPSSTLAPQDYAASLRGLPLTPK